MHDQSLQSISIPLEVEGGRTSPASRQQSNPSFGTPSTSQESSLVLVVPSGTKLETQKGSTNALETQSSVTAAERKGERTHLRSRRCRFPRPSFPVEALGNTSPSPSSSTSSASCSPRGSNGSLDLALEIVDSPSPESRPAKYRPGLLIVARLPRRFVVGGRRGEVSLLEEGAERTSSAASCSLSELVLSSEEKEGSLELEG